MAAQDADEQLLHLKLAFLAGEPPACVLTLARQRNIKTVIIQQLFLKGLYLRLKYHQTLSLKNFMRNLLSKNSLINRADHVYKEVSFLSPTHYSISPRLVSTVARLSCSSNVLEGDTGCSLWPSSLFLSEFILTYPKVFSNKCCFELGSGVGLVGVCLNYIGASKIILTDGDASTLANMKENMELNNLRIEGGDSELSKGSTNKVDCKDLSWEEVSESDLWGYRPDIVILLWYDAYKALVFRDNTAWTYHLISTNIIYDPICVPHLVRVLSMLLRTNGDEFAREGPVAYIVMVVRNVETFNCFAKAASDAKLSVANITSDAAPANSLPYMLSYDRSSVQLLKIISLS